MAETMFKDETQEMQAQACYDMAMERIGKQFPEISPDTYADRVWLAVAGEVVHNGYESAKTYALTAQVHV